MVLFVLETRLALTLTVAAMMVSIALDHVVPADGGTGLRRGWAIAITTLAVILLITGLMLDRRSGRRPSAQGLHRLRAAHPRVPSSTRRASSP
jgi:hypothetical protein